MSPTDYTDFPSDPSELGHLMADDCRERASNIANDRIDEAVEAHQNIKHAARDAARRAADAHLWAAAIARELGRSADEAGTARLAADLKGGAK
jgi:hypothetical protein